ncbi:laccase-1 [Camponotus floridanus]|uniref:laccase-1 n=1 Tax=Camponotus floridanus TaxID=104421 RepID=UPI00059DE5FD|nr:laccase-1 [Camponotus floridanus]
MRFFWFYSIMSLSTPVIILIFLININIQFCEASSFWSSSQKSMQISTPEECARECKDGEQPKTCYYHFVLEYYTSNNRACDFCEQPLNNSGITSLCECVKGDGIEKTIFSINRMIPSPSIQVCKNDYIIIDVQNDAEGLEASIHWHGIFQNGYQYFDGVPFVTQCPILSSNTFRYQFRVKNSGTHFYHSHISVHMIDGQYGSLIVRDPPQLNPHYGSYDEDRLEHVIIISDWMHELSLERLPGRYRTNSGQTPDNFLINGRGNWTDPSSGTSTNVLLPMFMIEKGKKCRFRMINACSTVCLIEVKIENHPMQIIATDGENVKPRDADAITMATGNIYLTYVYIMCIYRVFPVSRNKIKP